MRPAPESDTANRSATAPATDTTDNAMFEGLFVRALDVSGPLEEELRRLGYDRRKAQGRYPSATFVACLDAARRHLHGALPEAEGMRRLGEAFAGGFRQTILGQIFVGAMGLLGPRGFITRVPKRLVAMRPGLVCTLRQPGPTQYELTMQEAWPLGDFFAGAIGTALGFAGARNAKVTSEQRPGGYVVTASW